MKNKTFIGWLKHRASKLLKTGGYLMMTNKEEEKLMYEIIKELQKLGIIDEKHKRYF